MIDRASWNQPNQPHRPTLQGRPAPHGRPALQRQPSPGRPQMAPLRPAHPQPHELVANVITVRQSPRGDKYMTQAVVRTDDGQQLVAVWLRPDGYLQIQEQQRYRLSGNIQQLNGQPVLMQPVASIVAAEETTQAAPKKSRKAQKAKQHHRQAWGLKAKLAIGTAAAVLVLGAGGAAWHFTNGFTFSGTDKAASTKQPAQVPAQKPPTKPPVNMPTVAGTATAASSGVATTFSDYDPNNALAHCKDGTYDHGAQKADACAKHGGVAAQ